MEVKVLHDLIKTGNIDEAKKVFSVNKDVTIITNALKQYNPKDHDVHDPIKRPNKKLDGGKVGVVTRLSTPIQKKIVLLSAAFLGNPTLESTPKEGAEQSLYDEIVNTWEDNKLDYRFKRIAKRVMSELECAELWYVQDSEEGAKLRMRLLHNSYDPVSRTGGDSLYPVFDAYGDMIAFGRGYTITENDEKVEYFEIYTAETFYYLKKNADIWEFINIPTDAVDEAGNVVLVPGVNGVKNPFGKIPIIYYQQEVTEWSDVQEMIDRLEKKISNHADTNDRFDSPILFTEGEVEQFNIEKDDTGKLLEGKNGAKASYITWDSAPESMKMEIDNLLTFIHEFTHTPRLTFETVAGKGIEFSGVALKMLFLDAHMKASDKEDMFGECIQRRINYLKNALCILNAELKPAIKLAIKPKFEYFLPKNIPEMVSTLVEAVQGGIMSVETAVKQNELVQDGDAELTLMSKEATKRAAAQSSPEGLDDLMNDTPVVPLKTATN